MINVVLVFCGFFCAAFLLIFLGAKLLAALFPSRVKEESIRKKLLHGALLAAVIVFAFTLYLFPVSPGGIQSRPEVRTRNMEEQIRAAILNYENEYGVPPPAKNNAELVRVLGGNGMLSPANPRSIIFLTFRPSEFNARGEIVDAWGTPFRIFIADPQNATVQSAGPDRIWGNADDVDRTGK